MRVLSLDHDWGEAYVDGGASVTACRNCGVGYFTRLFELTWWKKRHDLKADRCDPALVEHDHRQQIVEKAA